MHRLSEATAHLGINVKAGSKLHHSLFADVLNVENSAQIPRAQIVIVSRPVLELIC
jgi:hypothetical protein